MAKQRTIEKSVSFSGIGLHTGNPSTITFHPAPAGYGYKFIRTDLPNESEIPALVDYVVDLSRGTTLGKDDIRVHTVEHVLAALAGLEIDNCRIELSANEPPVVDGSSMPYVEALQEAGINELDEDREYFKIKETIRYTNEEKGVDIVALPTDDYRLTVMIDYNNPALGSQHTGLFDFENEFVSEFAPARTFCFFTEVESLYEAGLIKGGSLESALVIVDKDVNKLELENMKKVFKLDEAPKKGKSGILNDTPLRFKNEPARHKLLDMIGDLTLAGVPIKAQVLAARPGHASNYEFAKLIRAQYLKYREKEKYKVHKKDGFVFDIVDLMRILPHRYPFLMVDRITDFDLKYRKIIGYKNVSINEPYFQGHFPGKPIMPGVLILEAMAQTGGIMLMNTIDDIEKKLAFFMSIDKAKFRIPVVPGDQLVFEVRELSHRFNTFLFEAKAFVKGRLAAEAELKAALVDR